MRTVGSNPTRSALPGPFAAAYPPDPRCAPGAYAHNRYMGIQRDNGFYIKTGGRRPHQIDLEVVGLRWLGRAQDDGGAHVVPVADAKPGWLKIPEVPSARCTREAAHAFGRALAITHAAGAPYLGAAPDGWDGDGWMGNAHLIYQKPDTANRSWGRFFALERLVPNIGPARDNGSLSPAGVKVIEAVCAKLADGVYDHAEPARVRTPAARIHGDLWSGNVLWAPRKELTWAPSAAGRGAEGSASLPEVVGVLIDPAAQGGHAETDLASLEIFGQPHLDAIYAGYNEVSALEAGWRERMGLHQLHMLLVHANLFGGSYGPETVACARRYA